IPGLVVMAPKNGEELRDMLWTAVHHRGGPISVRYPRANIPEEALPAGEPRLIPTGQSEQLRAGGDVGRLALGTMVLPAPPDARQGGARRRVSCPGSGEAATRCASTSASPPRWGSAAIRSRASPSGAGSCCPWAVTAPLSPAPAPWPDGAERCCP